MENRIINVLEEQIMNLENLKKTEYVTEVVKLGDVLIDCLKKGNKILIAGNGGSAADSQHFAAELVGRFMAERKGLPAIALTTDSSILTSMGNDYSFDDIFRRQIEALGKSGDVFIGISTSGNSKNVIEAVQEAKKRDIITIGLLGKDGGQLKNLTDYDITFKYKDTARVQEHHIMTIHLLCEIIEKSLLEV